MAKAYENKANHNEDFLNCLHNDYPSEYFDWKVTVQFYTALHKCYCVLLTNEYDVLPSHRDNIENLKEIDKDLSRKLHLVYKNSRQSRYEGFVKEEAMLLINKINFDRGQQILKEIKSLVSKYYPVAV